MDRDSEHRRDFALTREDAWPCVWMTAGVVAYKLCDHDFDCENCPLDIGLRGGDRPCDDILSVPVIEDLRFPDDRLYHPSHTWAQPVGEDRVRCGIDAFAASLLRNSTKLILPAPRAELRQGLVGFWISGSDRPMPILSPVSGRVDRGNPAARERPSRVVESAYDLGWLVEVTCTDWARQSKALIDASRMEQRTSRQVASLRRRVSRFVDAHADAVGPTMADGGERIGQIEALLGTARYRKIVISFLA
jgi:glycine cleavage system H lipoate-binding protein